MFYSNSYDWKWKNMWLFFDSFLIISTNAGKVLDRKGLTKAGRALGKHGGREGSFFPKPTGNPVQINKQGQEILERILNHPNKKVSRYLFKQYGEIIDIKAPELGGLRYNIKGELIGFLEPWGEKMGKFEITVGSLPDKDNLVADIYYDKIQVAEINQETNELIIQIYSYKNINYWEFSLEEFQNIIEEAKQRLIAVG